MKKLVYFVLLAAELFLGTLLLMSLWSNNMTVTCIASVAVMLALLMWQVIRFFRVTDLTAKTKILRNIALIMLIPLAVFIVVFLYGAIVFIIAFS